MIVVNCAEEKKWRLWYAPPDAAVDALR